MDDEIRDAGRRHGPDQDRLPVRQSRWTSTTCDIASLATARSIVVLAPETDEPDADVIKTMLAITNDPRPPRGAVSHRRRAPRPRERRGRPDGRPGRGSSSILVRGGHLADHRPDLPAVRPVGGLRRAARLRRRRDLPRPSSRRSWGGRSARRCSAFADADGHRAAAGGRRAAPQPADGDASSARAIGSSSIAADDDTDPARRGRAGRRSTRPSSRAAVPAIAAPGADARPRLEPPGGRHHRGSSTPTSPPGSEIVVVSADPAWTARWPPSWTRPGDPRAPADRGAPRRPDRAGRRSTRSTCEAFDHIIVLCSRPPRSVASRRADAGHAAPPARHRRSGWATTSRSSARCSTCAIGRWPRWRGPTTSSSASGSISLMWPRSPRTSTSTRSSAICSIRQVSEIYLRPAARLRGARPAGAVRRPSSRLPGGRRLT